MASYSEINISEIKTLLTQTERIYFREQSRQNDPVGIVWDYQKEDQEAVAIITAALAYGRVPLLKKAVTNLLKPLGKFPKITLINSRITDLIDLYPTFQYRMTDRDDILDLLISLRHLYLNYPSLEDIYLEGTGGHVDRLGYLIRTIRQHRYRKELTRGFKYLLTDPSQGSTAKRMHLFARWMVRGPDAIDLGLWESVDPSLLVMPLDTHTSRICRYLGMTKRKSNDLKAALEVTDFLKLLDPHDPLKYDFPICHLGISGDCQHTYNIDHCSQCPLQSACTIANIV